MKVNKEKINLILILIYFILNANLFVNIQVPIIINSIILLFVLLFNYKTVMYKNKNFMLLVMMNLISLMSILITNGGVGSFFNLLNFSLGILIFNTIRINKQDYFILFLVVFLIFIRMFLFSFDVWNDFLLGRALINPNGVAQNLFLSFCIIYSYLKCNTKKISKIILIILLAVSTYGIYLCNSRTILLSMIIYFLISYIPFLNKFLYKNIKVILTLLIIIGLVIPFLYVTMYEQNYNFVIPFSNKSLYTGREVLWGYMIKALNYNKIGYLLGLGTNYSTLMGIIDNYHSWYLGTLYTFGIFIYIIYFKYLINIISKTKKIEITYALVSIFIIGFFETAALWSNTQTYIFIIILFDRYQKINKEKVVTEDEKETNNCVYSHV